MHKRNRKLLFSMNLRSCFPAICCQFWLKYILIKFLEVWTFLMSTLIRCSMAGFWRSPPRTTADPDQVAGTNNSPFSPPIPCFALGKRGWVFSWNPGPSCFKQQVYDFIGAVLRKSLRWIRVERTQGKGWVWGSGLLLWISAFHWTAYWDSEEIFC